MKYYNSRDAAEYLRQKWGLEKFDVNAFRQYRHQRKIKPNPENPQGSNEHFWTQDDLDSMKPIKQTKQRFGRRLGSREESIGGTLDLQCHSVVSFA